MFAACKSNMDRLELDCSEISNVIQGTAWKNRKEAYGNKLVIRYCIYHDDFEPGNTLGSNGGVQSLSSFFVHFPTLAAHVQKKYGLDNILRPTIAELQNLEVEGILLEIVNQKIQVYFSLCLLLGDNKAMIELMGLTQCFKKKLVLQSMLLHG